MSSPLPKKVSGSVMVEFAGALILLLLLVLGISEIGRAIYQLNTLTKSVEASARYLSRVVGAMEFDATAEDPVNQCVPADDIWIPAKERAVNIILYGTESKGAVTRLPNMEEIPPTIEVIARPDASLGQGGACVIKVTATARFASIFGDNIIPDFFREEGEESPYRNIFFSADAEERYMGE